MSENKQRLQEFVKVVLSGGDLEASERFIDPAFVDHQPWPGQPGTLAGFKAGLADMRRAFPDLKVDVERAVADGELVSLLCSMSGTHLGDFLGAPATGKTFKVSGLEMVRLRGGRMVEHWGFFDSEGMARQLGMAPG